MAAKTVQNEGSGMHVCLILIITLQLIDSHAIAFEIIYYLHDSMMYISILSSFWKFDLPWVSQPAKSWYLAIGKCCADVSGIIVISTSSYIYLQWNIWKKAKSFTYCNMSLLIWRYLEKIIQNWNLLIQIDTIWHTDSDDHTFIDRLCFIVEIMRLTLGLRFIPPKQIFSEKNFICKTCMIWWGIPSFLFFLIQLRLWQK